MNNVNNAVKGSGYESNNERTRAKNGGSLVDGQ